MGVIWGKRRQYYYAVRGMQVNKQTKFGLDGMYRAELADAPAGLRMPTASRTTLATNSFTIDS